MYNRIFDIDSRLDEGMFLFGARQVGKSTLLKEKFKEAPSTQTGTIQRGP